MSGIGDQLWFTVHRLKTGYSSPVFNYFSSQHGQKEEGEEQCLS